MIKPTKLHFEDTIGVISTSSPVAALCPRRFDRGIEELKRLGFKVKVGRNALKKNGHLAGTVTERLKDFHELIDDKEVKAIINTIGGYNSNQLIDKIDYDLIRENPKIIMGYSDFTAVLLAIHKKTNMITYLGPSILPQFGEYGGIFDYTLQSFKNTLMSSSPKQEILPSSHWTSELLAWDKDDNRKRKLVLNQGPKILKKGVMHGEIIAGNMGTLLSLAGTDFIPAFDNKILFIEDDENESPATIDRYLTHMRHLGVFEKISGLVLGRFHLKVNLSTPKTLFSIINQATEGYDFPIVIDVDFGHTDPMLTLPNGVTATVYATDDIKIIYNENSVG
ncbi:LD-carboxypeptidase [Bacillus sp. WMMC1349]|uniref:S66 family peptidase n=1 Tax=Bacillus sp. WMMC1349 TaxID=2736254 RepID=UPI00155264CF|nr:S66 peptidase family protein [Bacillus sp. WMMC1349]NPC91943.1 LD-carboxypeptidase [Bacillus sp. WMMC1349]